MINLHNRTLGIVPSYVTIHLSDRVGSVRIHMINRGSFTFNSNCYYAIHYTTMKTDAIQAYFQSEYILLS